MFLQVTHIECLIYIACVKNPKDKSFERLNNCNSAGTGFQHFPVNALWTKKTGFWSFGGMNP
jgi:hypothetical protein